MYKPKHLKLWTYPECYIGETWEDYYEIYRKTRDSNLIDLSNFDCIWKEVQPLETEFKNEEGGVESTVVSVYEGHWLCGWIETIRIHKSNSKALEVADKLIEQLQEYPVLDEDDLSQREWDEYNKAWEEWGREEFTQAIKDKFNLSSTISLLFDEIDDVLIRELYEINIDSGEFYLIDDGGINLNIGVAMEEVDQDMLMGVLHSVQHLAKDKMLMKMEF